MGSALDSARGLDLSHRASGAWCTRRLADFGVDVVMLEPPAGHPLRAVGPFTSERSSIPAAYMLANKRSVMRPAPASEAFTRLVRWAQVIVDDALPGEATEATARSRINPQLIVYSSTPYGQDGKRAGLAGNEMI